MNPVTLFKKPIFVEFDRRRQLVFDLNTEIIIRQAGGENSSLWQTIGERTDPKTGKVEHTLDVNLENLRLYLWAAMQEDAKANGQTLALDEVGTMLKRRKWVIKAVEAITEALRQYYGDDPQGEADAPAASV
jgi:hypothetical protein